MQEPRCSSSPIAAKYFSVPDTLTYLRMWLLTIVNERGGPKTDTEECCPPIDSLRDSLDTTLPYVEYNLYLSGNRGSIESEQSQLCQTCFIQGVGESLHCRAACAPLSAYSATFARRIVLSGAQRSRVQSTVPMQTTHSVRSFNTTHSAV